MATIVILAGLVMAGMAAVRLAARAFRAEHLVVMRAGDGEAWLFERGGDGRYGRLPWTGLPAALRRFACGVPAVERARADA